MTYMPLKAFYKELVTNKHCTGDIWSNLPTHGLLKENYLPGIVITPACDLANDKVETITYLPVISISNFLTTSSFLIEIKSALLGISDQLKYTEFRAFTNQVWPPSSYDMERMKTAISGLTETTKKKDLCEKFLTLISHIENTLSDKPMRADMQSLPVAIGKKNFDKMLSKIITNGYRNDIHYLPPDGESPSWSVIREHSLIMFRYPLTAPTEVFDLAQTGLLPNWENEISAMTSVPMSKAFTKHQPIKTLRINSNFLHDILNRFVSLYSRIGSPDLTISAVNGIVNNLKGAK